MVRWTTCTTWTIWIIWRAVWAVSVLEDWLDIWGALEGGDLVAPGVVTNVFSSLPVAIALTVEVVLGKLSFLDAEVEVSALVLDVFIDTAAALAGTLLVRLVPFATEVTEGSVLVVIVSGDVSSGGALGHVVVLLGGGEDSDSCKDELAHLFVVLDFDYNLAPNSPLNSGRAQKAPTHRQSSKPPQIN